MSEESGSERKRDDLEMAAIATSVTIMVFFVVYWAAQVQTTYELLALAYGW